MSVFGGNITELRKSKGISQTDFAKELHISRQAVSKWENGKSIPDAEMLTSVARYFGVTVDRLLNQKIWYSAPAAGYIPAPQMYYESDDTESEPHIPRRQTPLGVLFLIPMFILISAVLIWPAIQGIIRSFTSFNVLEAPKFIGLENFIRLFTEDDVFKTAVSNTITLTVLSTLIVGAFSFIAAFAVNAAHKIVKVAAILLFDIISLYTLCGGYVFLFFGDSHGFINSRLMESGAVSEPIQFLTDPAYMPGIQLLLYVLALTGPVLTAVCMIKARPVSDKMPLKLFLPLRHSLQVYAAVSLPVLLMPLTARVTTGAFGFPSADYAAHTLISHSTDYSFIRFELGYAGGINVVSFGYTLLTLIILFIISFVVMNVIAIVKNEIKKSGKPAVQNLTLIKKISIWVISAMVLLAALVLLFPLFMTVMSSFKPLDELFIFPPSILPKKPTAQAYHDFFELFRNSWSGYNPFISVFTKPLVPSLCVTVLCAVSAFGISYFGYGVRKPLYALVCLSFILLNFTIIPNIKLMSREMPTVFYAAFFSAAPIIGFVYLKSAVERALQYSKNPIVSAALNSIPVLLVTYIMCFVNPFSDYMLYYGQQRFSIYFPELSSSSVTRPNLLSVSQILFLSVAVGFLLVAAATVLIFYPRRKTAPPCDINN